MRFFIEHKEMFIFKNQGSVPRLVSPSKVRAHKPQQNLCTLLQCNTIFDRSYPIELFNDASAHVVAYYSKPTSDAESRYYYKLEINS